jgi:hypothetical protein
MLFPLMKRPVNVVLVRSIPILDHIRYTSCALHVTQLSARLEQIECHPTDDAQSYFTEIRVQDAPSDAHPQLDAHSCFSGEYRGWA